jgi:nucleoside-diphosphate-sugar epimerase
MARTAFVTGGTGFVGLNLVQKLKAEGWDVTALHRASSDLTYLKRFDPKLVVGEITDRASLEAVMPAGVDTIFHVAGDTNMWRQKNAEQTRNNVGGTENVVEAALKAGARRLIVTSSISAYGAVSGNVTEETPSNAASSRVNYERTKYLAQEVARAAISRGLEVVIMQPGAIMGPYDIGTWSRMFYMVRDGKLPGVPPARLTFTHVREVVNAHIAAADKGTNGGQYLLGGEHATMLELVQEIGRLLDRPTPDKPMPVAAIKIFAAVSDFISNFTHKAPDFTPEMADGLGGNFTVTSEKAIRELGYQVTPLKEMVKDCYDWMKAEGRI